MEKRRPYAPIFLALLLFGSSLLLGADSDLSPVDSTEDEGVETWFEEQASTVSNTLFVPRNQVLLEINTGTW